MQTREGTQCARSVFPFIKEKKSLKQKERRERERERICGTLRICVGLLLSCKLVRMSMNGAIRESKALPETTYSALFILMLQKKTKHLAASLGVWWCLQGV